MAIKAGRLGRGALGPQEAWSEARELVETCLLLAALSGLGCLHEQASST